MREIYFAICNSALSPAAEDWSNLRHVFKFRSQPTKPRLLQKLQAPNSLWRNSALEKNKHSSTKLLKWSVQIPTVYSWDWPLYFSCEIYYCRNQRHSWKKSNCIIDDEVEIRVVEKNKKVLTQSVTILLHRRLWLYIPCHVWNLTFKRTQSLNFNWKRRDTWKKRV